MSLRVLDQYLFEQQIQTEFETVNPGTFHITTAATESPTARP